MTKQDRSANLSRQAIADLILAAREGDARANAALWARCSAMAKRIAHRWAVSSADADDISQEALLRAFRDLDSVRDPAALAGWLQVVIVRAVARQARRDATRRSVHAISERGATSEPSPDTQVDLRRVLTLLGGLPEEQRNCFLLRRAEGLTIPEIARETALSPATIYRRTRVAERRIARLVRDRRRAR